MQQTFTLTNDYHVERSLDFISNFNDDTSYFFVGDFSVHADSTLNFANNTLDSLYYNVFSNMIMGKSVANTNLVLAVPNIPYTSSTVYTPYDDAADLSDKNFYCVVNAGSYSHVYKCLYNNKGANSTVQPNFAYINGANTTLYQTSDGYQWKYLYSVDSATISTFATNEYFPVIANNATTSIAVPGAVNVIKIENSGQLYNNYLSGTLLASDIRVEPKVYQVSNSSINIVRGFYSGCYMYLNAGVGVGQYQIIVDYYSNASGNYVLLDNEFHISPTNGTTFQISPRVEIINAGSNTSDLCVARAVVNAASSNSVSSIEILHPGSGQYFVTADIIANSAVGLLSSNKAILRPILSPQGGHGANVASELNACFVIMSTSLSNSESNTILTTNRFQQIGLIQNPTFANVQLNLANTTNFFSLNEIVSAVNLKLVDANVTLNSTSAIVTGSNSSLFQSLFSPGTQICVSNGSVYQLTNVVSVANNLSLTIASNGMYNGNTLSLYYSNIHENMSVITVANENQIYVSNVAGLINVGSSIIGQTSGSYANISSIVRNGVTKDFKTFIQLYKYTIVPVHGTFVAGENITSGNTSALLHSVVANTTMYTSAQLPTNANVIGSNSGAQALITATYAPELSIGSGTVQYIDNISPVTRQPTQNEVFKIVLDF